MSYIRALLWVVPDDAENTMRVSAYEAEPGGEQFVPGGPVPADTRSPTLLHEWLASGWRFAPLSYYTTLNSTTVVALEHD